MKAICGFIFLKQTRLASKLENNQLETGDKIVFVIVISLLFPAASQRAAAHLWGKLGRTDEEGVKTRERLPVGTFSPLMRERGEKIKLNKRGRDA